MSLRSGSETSGKQLGSKRVLFSTEAAPVDRWDQNIHLLGFPLGVPLPVHFPQLLLLKCKNMLI